MKTRAELMEEAEKVHKETINYLEKQIARALANKNTTVEHYCDEELYQRFKIEIEKAGFRTTWLNLRSPCHSPKMIIHL